MSQQLGDPPFTIPEVPPDPVPASVASPAHNEGLRETLEAIVVAFILAFLFRTFEAEAFVIPTGSMAPTLMGRHKDFECPECKIPYRVNAAREVDKDTGARIPSKNVTHATCPNCRYTVTVDESATAGAYPSYSGDRILANKLAYQFGEPTRWDVVLFKFPLGPKTNFIKRLVGLPGETISIHRGDLYLHDDNDQPTILRKPPSKVLATRQLVYDDDYPARRLHEAGYPHRWQPDVSASGESSNAWEIDRQAHAYHKANAATEPAWLRYHHIVPTFFDWQALDKGAPLAVSAATPQVITDYYAYNAWLDQVGKTSPRAHQLGLHWVGDLVVEFEVTSDDQRGDLLIELVEAGRRFTARVDLATGDAELAIEGRPEFAPRAATNLQTSGAHHVIFAHVDDQLLLWVDDELVDFGTSTAYPQFDEALPTAADLAPVGIAVVDGTATVKHLRVYRDLHYISTKSSRKNREGDRSDYLAGNGKRPDHLSPLDAAGFFADPSSWGSIAKTRRVRFTLGPDQFLCFGDNSPFSNDSRVWDATGTEFYVRREYLIGKALCVYWPHAWETHPSTTIPRSEIRIPFYPNFARMKRIR